MVLTKNLSPDSFHELLVLSASRTTGRQLVSCTDEDQETHSFHAGFRISLKVFINNSCVKFPPLSLSNIWKSNWGLLQCWLLKRGYLLSCIFKILRRDASFKYICSIKCCLHFFPLLFVLLFKRKKCWSKLETSVKWI